MLMDANQIADFIGNYGFPIVCCAALFWKMDKQDKEHREEMEKHDAVHMEETKALRESLDNNTTVLTRILAKIGDVL